MSEFDYFGHQINQLPIGGWLIIVVIIAYFLVTSCDFRDLVILLILLLVLAMPFRNGSHKQCQC